MKPTSFALAFAPLTLLACVEEHDYQGRYRMTYDVIMTPSNGRAAEVHAGVTVVDVRHGLVDEYLIDLGSAFCQIEGTYVGMIYGDDWPHLDVWPQACWFEAEGAVHAMELTGTVTFDRNDRLNVVLSGTFLDPAEELRGSATLELTETW